MKEGTDYGKIPRTPKPGLWKPGAELLARWLNLVPQSSLTEKAEDWDKAFFMYKVETSFYNREGLTMNGKLDDTLSRLNRLRGIDSCRSDFPVESTVLAATLR